jgi:hypothetical protein
MYAEPPAVTGQGDMPPVREADQPPSAAAAAMYAEPPAVTGQGDVPPVREADQPPSAAAVAMYAEPPAVTGQGDMPPVREADQPPSAAARVWGNKPRAVMQAGPPGMREWEEAATTIEMGAVDLALDLPPDEECVICLGARRTTAMDPCGHFCVCDACAASCLAGGCPLCRGVVEKTLRIYV